MWWYVDIQCYHALRLWGIDPLHHIASSWWLLKRRHLGAAPHLGRLRQGLLQMDGLNALRSFVTCSTPIPTPLVCICNMYTYIYMCILVLLGMIWDDIQGTVLVAWKAASNNDHLDVPKCKHLANLALEKHRGTRQQGRPSMSSLDFAGFPQFGRSGYPKIGPVFVSVIPNYHKWSSYSL